MQLQVAYDDALVDAMLFDEAARALLGVQATAFKRALLPRHPMLPFVLADLLEGLHVAFHFQRRRQPSSSNPSSKPQYTVRPSCHVYKLKSKSQLQCVIDGAVA